MSDTASGILTSFRALLMGAQAEKDPGAIRAVLQAWKDFCITLDKREPEVWNPQYLKDPDDTDPKATTWTPTPKLRYGIESLPQGVQWGQEFVEAKTDFDAEPTPTGRATVPNTSPSDVTSEKPIRNLSPGLHEIHNKAAAMLSPWSREVTELTQMQTAIDAVSSHKEAINRKFGKKAADQACEFLQTALTERMFSFAQKHVTNGARLSDFIDGDHHPDMSALNPHEVALRETKGEHNQSFQGRFLHKDFFKRAEEAAQAKENMLNLWRKLIKQVDGGRNVEDVWKELGGPKCEVRLLAAENPDNNDLARQLRDRDPRRTHNTHKPRTPTALARLAQPKKGLSR